FRGERWTLDLSIKPSEMLLRAIHAPIGYVQSDISSRGSLTPCASRARLDGSMSVGWRGPLPGPHRCGAALRWGRRAAGDGGFGTMRFSASAGALAGPTPATPGTSTHVSPPNVSPRSEATTTRYPYGPPPPTVESSYATVPAASHSTVARLVHSPPPRR